MRFALPLLAALPLMGAAPVDFSRQIRPILSENCFFCHGPDEKKREAGLRLDDETEAKKNRDGVTAIVPGKPEASELLLRILSRDPDEVMPPPKQHKIIPAAQVELLRQWIAQGAPWGAHWSYQPVKRPPQPAAVAGGNAIDAFLHQRLRQEQLDYAPAAEISTIIRRLALDLTGLPPSPEELRKLSAMTQQQRAAYYLNLPAFGEHWASWWLDLARYADSSGYPSDQPREIWAYRDWVINAFNRNLPFDQFTTLQIAGDLLPQPSDEDLIATAFHRNTMTQNEGGTSDEEFRVAAVIDRVNTTFAVWMGTTMACAQCHTHKYDPLTQREYYQFYDFLNQSQDSDKKDEVPLHRFHSVEQRAKRSALEAQIAAGKAQLRQPPQAWAQGLATIKKAWQSPHAAASDAKGLVALATNLRALQALRLDRSSATDAKGAAWPPQKLGLEALPKTTLPAARWLRIELPGKGKFLQLAEVQAFAKGRNVAQGKSARFSSTYMQAVAARAVDGNTNGDYHKGSVAHSGGNDALSFWEVDLGADTTLDEIVLWNRTDGGTGQRSAGLTVQLLDAKRQLLWNSGPQPAPQPSARLKPAGPSRLAIGHVIASSADGRRVEVLSFEAAKSAAGITLPALKFVPDQLWLLPTSPAPKDSASLRIEGLGASALALSDDPLWQGLRGLSPSEVQAMLTQGSAEAEARALAIYASKLSPQAMAAQRELAALEKQLAALAPSSVPIMRDLPADKRRRTQIQLRGNWQALGDEVTAATPAALHPLPGNAPRNRLGMAQWLISRDNPLTARVQVNRLWEQVFGVGIVRTSEEFGSQGELPVHPELLDWLAAELMDSGWDFKHVLELMVTSRAYQQRSHCSPELAERDPDNRLLARGPRHRPSGELLRDQALAACGLLSRKMGGVSVRPPAPNLGLSTAFGRSNDWITSSGEDRHRRSVYTEVRRNAPYASFSTFDAGNREVCMLRRGRSNTPLQALVTLNDPVFVETHQAMAKRLMQELPEDAARLDRLFVLTLARAPKASERKALMELLAHNLQHYQSAAADAKAMAGAELLKPADPATVAAQAAWTTVASVVMNLDEFLMRP